MLLPTVILSLLVLLLASLVFAGHSDPTEAPTICAEAGSDSILIAHEDCDKFYKCFQGKPVALSCPDNLLYNPDEEYCDWGENVNCRGDAKEEKPINNGKEDTRLEEIEEVIENKENKDEANKVCAEEGSDGKLLAHEECYKFYECAGGKAVAFTCPDDLQFNPEKKICDWPDNVNCVKT